MRRAILRISLMLCAYVLIATVAASVHLPYRLVLVHGYLGNGSVWYDNTHAPKSFIDAIQEEFTFQEVITPSLYDEWEERRKVNWKNDPQATIKNFGKFLYTTHIAATNTKGEIPESIIIAHSMGGLFARWAAIEGEAAKTGSEKRKVKGIITIGTPHLGAPVANKWNWWLTSLILDTYVHTPLILDIYPETNWVGKIISGAVVTIATIILAAFIAFLFECEVKINLDLILDPIIETAAGILAGASFVIVFVIMSAYIASVKVPVQAQQVLPNSAHMRLLNSKKLPVKDADGLPTFYGCIRGHDSDLFGLIEDRFGKEARNIFYEASKYLSNTYLIVGSWHLIRSVGWFWFDSYRFITGCAYLISAASLNPRSLSAVYNTKIIGENTFRFLLSMVNSKIKTGDGFIPEWSQVMPENVIPSGSFKITKPATNDNHQEEIWGNSQSVKQVIDILNTAKDKGIFKKVAR